jgi:hypothetical protein
MILNSDSYYFQGSNHKHNDDYALNGKTNQEYCEWAAISDGCSGSRFSDCGARVMIHSSVESIFQEITNIEFFEKELLNNAKYAKEALFLPEKALDATLFHLAVNNDSCLKSYKKYVINAYGDGAIIKIKNDNSVELTYIEYPSGAPLYLNYFSNPERFKNYKNQYGLQRKIYKYTFINNIAIGFKVDIDSAGDSYFEIGSVDDYKAILVTSDGISSFIDQDKKHIELSILVRNLIDFKSYKGEFIQRRMNGFNILCEKQGWKHTDDFSIAGIHINHEQL